MWGIWRLYVFEDFPYFVQLSKFTLRERGEGERERERERETETETETERQTETETEGQRQRDRDRDKQIDRETFNYSAINSKN